LTASSLVLIILHKGQAFATDVGERKKIVMVPNKVALELLQPALLGGGIKVVHALSFINALAIELSPNGTIQEASATLDNLLKQVLGLLASQVVVSNDLVFSVLRIAQAPLEDVPLQETYGWGLEHIHVDEAHEMSDATGSEVKVAVVDTGVDCGHPDLRLFIEGFNALPDGGSFCDNHGHGTHMAGIIAASKGNLVLEGIIGAAPQVHLVAVKVLDAKGKGYLSDLINGLQWIWTYNAENKKQIRIINMSLGFNADSSPLKTAIEKLFKDYGIIMVASAGNSCSDSGGGQEEAGGDEDQGATCDAPQTTTVKYPAAYPEVLAVTATDDTDQLTSYSLEGSAVDVTAPGGSGDCKSTERTERTKCILSTYVDGGYGYGKGTSQAAAHVTGALALKLQLQSALSLQDVQCLLQETATSLEGNPPKRQQGWGLIDAALLLETTCPNK
jgi:minor extracellular protease Epr